MLWRSPQHRPFHTLEYIHKKTGSLVAGCLDFLAQALTKTDSNKEADKGKVKKNKRKKRSWEEPAVNDQFQDEHDTGDISIASVPVALRECWDPQLRAEVAEIAQMKMRADPRSYSHVIRECTKKKALLEGKQIHAHICNGGFEPDTVLGNLLIQMYGSCGSLDEARAVFNALKSANIYSSNIMIAAYAQNGYLQDAVSVFENAKETNVVTWNTIVSAYAQNDSLPEARLIFEMTPSRNVVSWNNMIAANAHAGHFASALLLFRRMDLEGVKPNRVTYLHVLDSCTSVAEGLVIHREFLASDIQIDIAIATGLVIMYGRCRYPEAARYIFDKLHRLDIVVWTAMVVAYAQNGNMENARSVFDKMPAWNEVTWSAIVAAYAQNGHPLPALRLFKLMDLEGVPVEKITLISAFDACAGGSVISLGRILHSSVAEDEILRDDVPIGNAIVNMYGKCGELERSKDKFSAMPRKNVVSWSAMLAAYAQNGRGEEGFEIFQKMQLEGVSANEVALCSLLSAATHANKFLEGILYFLNVPEDYGFHRTMDHYGFVLEILNSSGLLHKAEELSDFNKFLAVCSDLHRTLRIVKIPSSNLNNLKP